MKGIKNYITLLYFVVLSSNINLHAQRYPFFNLNVENGLIQSQVRGGLAQDKEGNLWIATMGGASKYDGKNITNYTVRDGLLSNDVSSIVADEKGTIWMGNNKGITKVGTKGFVHYSLKTEPLSEASTVSKIIAADNALWCLLDGSIVKFKDGKSTSLHLPTHIKATAFLVQQEVFIIAAENGKIYRLNKQIIDSASIPVQKKTFVFELLSDKKNNILIATNNGLYVMKGNHITPYRIHQLPMPFGITSLTQDKTGRLWAGTGSGVIAFNDTSFQWFHKKNGLCNNPFYQVLTDQEGNVWMASDGQGVFRFSGSEFTSLDEHYGLPSAQVMSIAADTKGTLYFGTFEDGLYSYHKGTIRKIKLPEGYTAIMTMRYVNHSLWMGVAGKGLVAYRDGIMNVFTTQNTSLPSNFVSAIYVDEQQRMWIGTLNGLAYLQQDKWVRVPMPDAAVRDIISIGNDSILLATSSGLQLFHQGQVVDFVTGKAPDSAMPQCFLKLGSELWIGTSDNGLIYYHPKNQKSFVLHKGNGLQSDFIYNIINDNDSNIWVGTGYGIHKIIYKNKPQPTIHYYGKEQGISGMESNHRAVLKMPDGSIWFGTTNGATHYIPTNNNITPAPISIVMQSVKLFGNTITDTSCFDSLDHWNKIPYGLRLPYKKNNLSFSFQAVSLTAGEQVQYRYRIKGLDAHWSEWTKENTITYPSLPPGLYQLEVESQSPGNNKLQRLQYPFEIITPFHQSSLFKVIILGACILLGITIQYIANYRKQNRIKLLQALRREEQDKVRQRTAEDFHDEVGNKITRINILTNVLKTKMGTPSQETEQIIHQIQNNTDQLYSGTRDILWSLKPSNDYLYQILLHIRDLGIELFQYGDAEFTADIDVDASLPYRLPLDVSRNLVMIFKEAMHNCLKYAAATKVHFSATLLDNNRVEVGLYDNGKGFDVAQAINGHGLGNMRIRAQRIKGQFHIESSSEKGTKILLNFNPMPDIP